MKKLFLMAMSILLAATPATARTGTSPPIRLVVNLAAITEQPPEFVSLFTGEQFSVTVATNVEYPDVAYQWYFDGGVMPGETNATLTIASVVGLDAGIYRCRISSATGGFDEYSSTCTLTVYGVLGISQHPWPQTADIGDSVAFVVEASGGVPPITYQWYLDNVLISGATGATYNIASIVAEDAGDYTCVISDNALNSVTSNPATLTVLPASTPPAEFVLTYITGENTFTLVFNAHQSSLASILSAPEMLPANTDFGNITAIGLYYKLSASPWTILEAHDVTVAQDGDTATITFTGHGEDWSGNPTTTAIDGLGFLGNWYFLLDNMGQQAVWLNPDVVSTFVNLIESGKVLDGTVTMFQIQF